MNSMTGYGRGRAEIDGREITAELKSVNHRFLDLGFRLPRNLAFLEETARSLLSDRFSRGHIDVFVTYRNLREDAASVRIDAARAKQIDREARKLAEEFSLDGGLSLEALIAMPDVLVTEQNEEDQDAVRAVFERALGEAADQMERMRASEGAHLKADLLQKLAAVEALREGIAARAPQVVDAYRERLKRKLSDLLQGALDESRFVTEVALFADRAAIDEELVRLVSHFAQMRAMAGEAQPVGRKLDFLVQEINREFNTIGSKAMDAEIARLVVDAKSEIEKMREQVQNIE